MNQISRSTRTTKKMQDIHPLVTALDENDADQRRLRDLIRRFHSGRWPLFRCLGMRNVNGAFVEAVEWLRASPPRYSVIYWQSDGLGVSWCTVKGPHGAKRHLCNLTNLQKCTTVEH